MKPTAPTFDAAAAVAEEVMLAALVVGGYLTRTPEGLMRTSKPFPVA
jgi:hypothetical protein